MECGASPVLCSFEFVLVVRLGGVRSRVVVRGIVGKVVGVIPSLVTAMSSSGSS